MKTFLDAENGVRQFDTTQKGAIASFLGIIVLSAMIGGLIFIAADRGKRSEPAIVSDTSQVARVEEFTMYELNNSGIDGYTRITFLKDGAHIETNVSGTPQNLEQPLAVRFGSCTDTSGIAKSLGTLVNGKSETVLDKKEKDELLGIFESNTPVAVTIQFSRENTETVSCGDPLDTAASIVARPPLDERPKPEEELGIGGDADSVLE